MHCACGCRPAAAYADEATEDRLGGLYISSQDQDVDQVLRRTVKCLQGRYDNYCRVGQNARELVINFEQRYGEAETPLFHKRIVTPPGYMKAILAALDEAVELEERRFSESSQGME